MYLRRVMFKKLIIGGVIVSLLSSTPVFAADPSKEVIKDTIIKFAKEVYEKTLTQATKAKEDIPSENSFNFAFGSVPIPSGVSVKPMEHLITDRYKYGIKIYVCSFGISETSCVNQPKNGNTSSSAKTSTSTTPSTSNKGSVNTQTQGQGNSQGSATNQPSSVNSNQVNNPSSVGITNDPGSVNIENTPSDGSTTPVVEEKPKLPSLFKSLTLKQNGNNLESSIVYAKKNSSTITLTLYKNKKKVSSIQGKGSKSLFIFKNIKSGEYVVTVTSKSSSNSKSSKIKFLELPDKPEEVKITGIDNIRVSWLGDMGNFYIYDENVAEVTGSDITFHFSDGDIVKKYIKKPNLSYTLEGYKKDDLRFINISYRTKVGNTEVTKVRNSYQVKDGVRVTQVSERSVKLSWAADETPVKSELLIEGSGLLKDKEIIVLDKEVREYLISDLSVGGRYKFTILNHYSDESLTKVLSNEFLLVKLPPQITNITLQPLDKSIMLKFLVSESDLSNIDYFIVEYKANDTLVTDSLMVKKSQYIDGILLSNLRNNVTYLVTIKSVNSIGSSSSSTYSSQGLTVPSKPLITEIKTTSSSMDVSWVYDGVNEVNSFLLEYKLTSQSSYTQIPLANNIYNYNITNLLPNSSYDVRVTGRNNNGYGLPSIVRTMVLKSNSNAITLSSPVIRDGEIQLNWSTPSAVLLDDYLKGFRVYYKLNEDSNWTVLNTSGNAESIVFTNLVSGRNYNFKVEANLDGSIGNLITMSNTVSGGFLTRPTDIRNLALTSTSNSISGTFLAPLNSGGGTLTYKIYYKKISDNTYTFWGSTSNLLFTISSLDLGVLYTLRVVASNGGYDSDGILGSKNTVATPEKVSSLAVLRNPLSPNQVTVSWSQPTNNGGEATSKYKVEFKLATDSIYTLLTDQLALNQIAVTSLSGGVTYDFRVTGYNSAGWGISDVIQGIPYGLPSTVNNFQGSSGINNIYLTWLAPSNLGGGSIQGYKLSYKLSSDTSFTVISGVINTLSYDLTGLQANTSYDFKIYAYNEVGNSSEVSLIKSTLPATAPSGVINLMLAPASNQIAVSWSAPNSNGSPITGYRVTVKDLSSPSNTATEIYNGSNLNALASSLTNGVSYEIEVFASNSVGESVGVKATATPN